jgi:carboxyl-terminal processing protease
MTVSEYFTPNGINIHGIGIEPDMEITLSEDAKGYGAEYYDTDNQLQKAVEILKEKMNQ